MPKPSDTLDESIRQLRVMLRACAEAEITATLTCDPPVVVGRTAVRVRARFFAPPEVLAKLAPVLRCEEMGELDGRRMKRTRRAGEYVLALPPGSLAGDRAYHATVHPDADSSPAAGCTLHTFSTRVVAAARTELREVLSPVDAGDTRRMHPRTRRK